MKCPLADYWRKRNVECPMPLKQDKEKCRQYCEYWRDGKCSYKKIIAEKEKGMMRGFGALTKQAIIKAQRRGSFDQEIARRAEQAGLRFSGLSKADQMEYWQISNAYDEERERSSPEKQAELEWRMHHWQRFMEDGFSPKEADERARELDYEFWSGMKNEDENP